MEHALPEIKVIIGLGNPGLAYYHTRHNIGFRVLDELAQQYHGTWKKEDKQETASIEINQKPVLLIKPQTFMNSSGLIIPALLRRGIKPENILVIHDELEHPFGKVTTRFGGSHRGHNGLRSIMEFAGPDFARIRYGIGRPEQKELVGTYVLEKFSEPDLEVETGVKKAIELIEQMF